MSRSKRNVYRCPDCLGVSDPVGLTRLGGLVREPFQERDGKPHPAVRVVSVLCWWCRERHSPDEVAACMALPRKVAPVEGSETSSSSSLAAGQWKSFPELWDFLTTTSYPDGAKRKTGKLSLSCESGLLGLLLTDAQTGQYAFLNGRSLDDLLAEAELRLGDGSMSWRASKYPARGR